MTPLTSVVVLFVLAIAVIALFAMRLHRMAGREEAVSPEARPASPAPAALEGALAAGD